MQLPIRTTVAPKGHALIKTVVYFFCYSDLVFRKWELLNENGSLFIENMSLFYKNGSLFYEHGSLFHENGSLFYENGSLFYKNGSLFYENGSLFYVNGSLFCENGSLLAETNRSFPLPLALPEVKAGVHVKAVLTSLNTAFLPISLSPFKRR